MLFVLVLSWLSLMTPLTTVSGSRCESSVTSTCENMCDVGLRSMAVKTVIFVGAVLEGSCIPENVGTIEIRKSTVCRDVDELRPTLQFIGKQHCRGEPLSSTTEDSTPKEIIILAKIVDSTTTTVAIAEPGRQMLKNITNKLNQDWLSLSGFLANVAASKLMFKYQKMMLLREVLKVYQELDYANLTTEQQRKVDSAKENELVDFIVPEIKQIIQSTPIPIIELKHGAVFPVWVILLGMALFVFVTTILGMKWFQSCGCRRNTLQLLSTITRNRIRPTIIHSTRTSSSPEEGEETLTTASPFFSRSAQPRPLTTRDYEPIPLSATPYSTTSTHPIISQTLVKVTTPKKSKKSVEQRKITRDQRLESIRVNLPSVPETSDRRISIEHPLETESEE